MVNELQIVWIPTGELTPWEKNARKHGKKDLDQIAESIRLDGFNDPVAVWGSRNIIVEGHGRWLAAKQMGITELPCIRLDHLTEEQWREYAIRHNRSAEFSTWDFQMLEEELAALEMDGIDMSGLEFRLDRENEQYIPPDGSGAIEYGEEVFGDDRFQCTCPECGFKFNEK